MTVQHLEPGNRRFLLFLLTSVLLHGIVSMALFWLGPYTASVVEPPAIIMVSLAPTPQQKRDTAQTIAPTIPVAVPKSSTASAPKPVQSVATPLTSAVPAVKPHETTPVKTAPDTISTKISGSGSVSPPHASTNAPDQSQQQPLQAGAGKKVSPAEMMFGSASGPAFIRHTMPVYPVLAKRRGKEGTVLLRLTISETGTLTHVEVLEDPGHGLSEAASEAVRSSSFSPARHNGRPITVRAILPIRFKLN